MKTTFFAYPGWRPIDSQLIGLLSTQGLNFSHIWSRITASNNSVFIRLAFLFNKYISKQHKNSILLIEALILIFNLLISCTNYANDKNSQPNVYSAWKIWFGKFNFEVNRVYAGLWNIFAYLSSRFLPRSDLINSSRRCKQWKSWRWCVPNCISGNWWRRLKITCQGRY